MPVIKKAAEQPRVVLVTITVEGRTRVERIVVPEGWSFRKRYADEVKLLDDKGRIQKIFDWELGSSKVYEYVYSDDPRAFL